MVTRYFSFLQRGDQLTGHPANAETIGAISSEIEAAKQKAEEADARAAKYSGGLLQLTGMLEAQTARLTESILRQKRALAEVGLGALAPIPEHADWSNQR